MSRRTQITLGDREYEALKTESARTGLSLAELVRRAVNTAYRPPREDVSAALEASAGAWERRDEDGAAYVERIRPGMSRRLGS